MRRAKTFSRSSQQIEGLVLWLRMQEGPDNIAFDYSHHSNHGKLMNNPTWTAHGIDFNGVDQYLDCGNDPSLDITNNITIEMWVKTDTGSGYLISKNDQSAGDHQYAIYTSSNKARYYPTGSPSSAVSSIPNSVWTHVVFTRTGGNGQFYINGVASGSSAACTMPSKPNFPVRLGCRWHLGTTAHLLFDGLMDAVRIYNRALSEDEISARFNSTKNIYGV